MAKRKTHKKPTHKRFIPLILIFFGIFCIIVPLGFYLNEGIQLAFFTPHLSQNAVTHPESIPTNIVIPSVQIDLPIFETAISHNTWEIASGGISHLSISARPNELGPIILYGHNTNDRFGPIRWLKVGEDIVITTKANKTHTYVITKTLDVSPNQTNIFNQKDETLILYTCDGFADLERFIVLAKPQ